MIESMFSWTSRAASLQFLNAWKIPVTMAVTPPSPMMAPRTLFTDWPMRSKAPMADVADLFVSFPNSRAFWVRRSICFSVATPPDVSAFMPILMVVS